MDETSRSIRSSSNHDAHSTAENTAGESPYSLRDHATSKPPTRFRDYDAAFPKEHSPSPAKQRRIRGYHSPIKHTATMRSDSSHPVVNVDDDTESSASGSSHPSNTVHLKDRREERPMFAIAHRDSHNMERPRSASIALGTASSTNLAQRRLSRPRPSQTDLTESLKENLRRLKNVLKLPKARRWVYCEFFYSEVDQQLFLGDNEFSQLLRESFPNLRCRKLCRPEWRAIRRLIGRPRRCSQAFLNEERNALEIKRAKIRQIYEGSMITLTPDSADLPLRLPRPLVVGVKIYARVRHPKDGIYAGTIDAVLPDSYRVVFDKEEMIPPMIISDSEVMSEQKVEMLSLTYFLEQNRAAMPNSFMKMGNSPYLGSKFADIRSSLIKSDAMMPSTNTKALSRRISAAIRDEKVGNFPVRMLVILVKLAKLIEMKRSMVRQLADMNSEAEKMNLLSDYSYPQPFQEKYAQVVINMEAVNKQMQSYLSIVTEYNSQLLPQLSSVSVTVRPDVLRKLCHTHAVQIVKHCNNGLSATHKGGLELATSFTALLLQLRALSQQRCTALDLSILMDSLSELRKRIHPSVQPYFEDNIEIHMKQIHNKMLYNGTV